MDEKYDQTFYQKSQKLGEAIDSMKEEYKLEMQELREEIKGQQRGRWNVIWQSLGKRLKEKKSPKKLKWIWKKHQETRHC